VALKERGNVRKSIRSKREPLCGAALSLGKTPYGRSVLEARDWRCDERHTVHSDHHHIQNRVIVLLFFENAQATR